MSCNWCDTAMAWLSAAASFLTSCSGWEAIFMVVGLLSVGSVVLPWVSNCILQGPQNLAIKYKAQWALVTGGSSGIGRSLCHKLAAQGLNIVVAAVPDALLKEAAEELAAKYPKIQVRAVGVDLSSSDPERYMAPLREATEDITVQIIFSNAGYMVTGFFAETPLPKWLANLHCNSTACVVVAHHFVNKLKAAGAKGCVVFTSSPANIMPSPFSAMYGATKALVTHFATSLACEVGPDGIDVGVVHPSPVATRFYNGAHALPTLNMFKSTATGPDRVAETMIRGVGRSVIIDQGYYPVALRVLLRLFDFTFLADVMPSAAHLMEDYKVLKAASKKAE